VEAGKYPKGSVEAEFELAAVQQVDEKNSYLAAHWKITGATPLAHTDVAFLNLVPNCEVAKRFLGRDHFLRLRCCHRIWDQECGRSDIPA